jgi:hypothetical protein
MKFIAQLVKELEKTSQQMTQVDVQNVVPHQEAKLESISIFIKNNIFMRNFILLTLAFITLLSGCGDDNDHFLGVDTSVLKNEIETQIKEINNSEEKNIDADLEAIFDEETNKLDALVGYVSSSDDFEVLKNKLFDIYGQGNRKRIYGNDFTIEYMKYNIMRSGGYRGEVYSWLLGNGNYVYLMEGEEYVAGHNIVYAIHNE